MDTADLLPGWREGDVKHAILEFVESVTTKGSAFVPPVARLATFDNDGTLCCEKPNYIQADFVIRKWTAMVTANPALAKDQPFKAVAEKDVKWLESALDHIPDVVKGVSAAFGDISTDAFEQEAQHFWDTARHPTLDVPCAQLAYRPMVELLNLLRVNDFQVFICSAGGRDFVRVISEGLYGISRDRVIGSSAPVKLENGTLMRTPGIEQPIDDGPGKPVHIWARTGRLPVFAGGNADGDIEMLSLARFALLVHHDDAKREFAYDAGAEHALTAAKEHDWTVASMARDFATIFDVATADH